MADRKQERAVQERRLKRTGTVTRTERIKKSMQRLSKRRGVISVFLLIIFMVTFVFTGLLVDAARYHMAAVYLEAALDSASESVLSNYNRLLFDLYGLFSVEVGADGSGTMDETEMKAKITELYNSYLDAALKTADIKLDSEYRTLLNDIFDEVSGKPVMEVNAGTENLYDFVIENLDCGTTVTLANPANVESQIIEYMKFRAPVQLIDETQGFLKKINSLLTMTDRVGEALKKTEITAQYEEPGNGEKGLSEKAYELQRDINEFAVKLYNYSVNPTKPLSSLGAASPDNMLVRNNVYGKDPYGIRTGMIQDFDRAIDGADQEFEEAMLGEDDAYASYLTGEFVSPLQRDIGDEQKKGPLEITLDASYSKSGGGKTSQFTEVDFKGLEISDKIRLAEDVYEKVKGKSEEIYKDYIEGFEKEKKEHEKEIQRIENDLTGKYQTARAELEAALKNMEANAEALYNEISQQGGLRDRMTEVVRLYESYIADLEKERQKNGGSQNKESVYAPEIELAESNLAEILKNADILLNSRQYLYNIAYGFPDEDGNNRERLSKWILDEADKIISHRKDCYITEGKYRMATSDNIPDMVREDLQERPLWKDTKAENANPKSAEESKDLFATKYVDFIKQAIGELLPEAQNHICILYSYASYFQTCYYRADVDVKVGDTENGAERVKNTEINSNEDSKPAEQEEGEKDNTQEQEENKEKLSLDNEKMLQASDYLEYLKVNYQPTERNENQEETQLGESVNGKVTLKTLVGILETGLHLLEKLEKLLEDARDNLYVDAYIISMLPNYSEFQRYNAGKYAKADLPTPFTAEYLPRNSSFAAVEYIITGAGEGSIEGLEGKIKKPKSEGDAGVGYGKLSMDAMRLKLFGTRLLFNGVSMMTDTAKLKQAARMSSWAGGLAPLVAAVLVIAWTIAETVIDVMVIMCEPKAKSFDPDETGEVYVFKQGKDWYFCLENAVSNLAKGAVKDVINQVEEKAIDLTKSLEQQTNRLIYDAYKQVKERAATVGEVLDGVSAKGAEVIDGWTKELGDRIGDLEINEDDPLQKGLRQKVQQEVAGLSGTINPAYSFHDAVGEVRDKIDEFADEVEYQAVIAVSRASEKVVEKAKTALGEIEKQASDFINKNIQNVIPIGQPVNSGSAEEDKSPKMGYRDYLYFYLFFMNGDLKIKRLQSVIQANMMVSGQEGFRMENSPASVWADMECSMKYLFLSDLLVPEWMRRDGRLQLKVISGQSY